MRRLCSTILLLLALAPLAMPVASNAQIISITIAPPELPVYEQPPIPAAGYMWSPGYWAYDPDGGYYWVPGTWVLPPTVGLLWTPGYWGWRDGIYAWNDGYWGPHIGFYGGVYYGYGYGGVGYEGGRWNNGVFVYNQTVNNFGSVTITNVYSQTVIVNNSATRASFNGGAGGTTAKPTPQELAAAHEQHVAATPAQVQQQHTASTNKALFASQNHGQPAIAATSKPGEFTGKGVVAARPVAPTGAEAVGKSPGGLSPQSTKPNAPGQAKLPNTKPAGAADKIGPAHDQAKLNGGGPPKSSTVGAKPPPPQVAKPNPPPRPVAAAKPPPPPPAKPAAKPACPPGKPGCK